MKKIYSNIIFSLIPLLILAVLFEGLIRITGIAAGLQYKLPAAPQVDYIQYDKNLFWRLKSNFFGQHEGIDLRINSLGMREAEFSITPKADSVRILCLGDSVTFGWRVPQLEIFSKQLEKILNEQGLPVEVINAGVPGYSSYQGLRYFTEELQILKPAILILGFGINDHWISPGGKTDLEYAEDAHTTLSNIREIFRKSFFYLWVEHFFWEKKSDRNNKTIWILDEDGNISNPEGKNGSKPPAKINRVNLEDFTNNIEKLIEIAKSTNNKIILLNEADQSDPSGQDEKFSFAAYRQQVQKISEDKNLPMVDIWQVLKDSGNYKDFFIDRWHPNATGHKLIAQKLSAIIRPLIDSKEN